MSFVHLGADNKVLQESIKNKLQCAKIEPCETKLFDFDDVNYRILIDHKDRTKLVIILNTLNFQPIREHAETFIKEKLGDYVSEFTDEGCKFEINLDDEKNVENAPMIAESFAKLRIYALGGPLYVYCKALQSSKPLKEPISFAFRSDTRMWIVPKKDRVTVVYAFEFNSHGDRIIGNQILTEFCEVRRKRDVQAAPSVSYSKSAPQEVRDMKEITFNSETFLGYFSILLIESHVSEKKFQGTIENVIGFRAYLTYHIKCAKAFFNQSMRARGKLMLKVLNRARYEGDSQKRKKKKIIVSAD